MKIKSILASLVLLAGMAFGQGQFAGGGSGNGTITGATSGGGLVVTGGTLGLLTSCSTNQVLSWNGSSWVCANSSGSSAFSALTSGTNTTGAFLIGSGASLGTTGSGTIQATSLTGLGACQPVLGNGSSAVIVSPSTCYVSQFTGATADVKLTAALTAAASLGYNVVLDLTGVQLLAASPFASTGFVGHVTVTGGAHYYMLAPWAQPSKVVTDALSLTNAGFTAGGSVFSACAASVGVCSSTAYTGVMFCLGSANGSACPAAGTGIGLGTRIENLQADGNNQNGVTIFQNYNSQEDSGFVNVSGVAWGYNGICADIGGGASAAINSTLRVNCANSTGTATAMTATAVGVLINGGATSLGSTLQNYGPRLDWDISVTNGCSAGTNSCTTGHGCTVAGGTCTQANDNIQLVGVGGLIFSVHCETYARACINIGNATLSGTDTPLATAGYSIDTVTCNAGHDCVRLGNAAAVDDIILRNIQMEGTSGNTINDQTNSPVLASVHQIVPLYITGDAAQVVIDASGTNVSGLVVNNLKFPVTVAGTTTSGGIPYFNSNTQLSASGALAANHVVLGGGAGSAPTSDSNLDDGATVANTLTYGGSAGISAVQLATTSASNAGAVALGGNTANPSLAANSVILLGPASASFTKYALQFPSTAPSGTQYLGCGTPSSNVSTCTWTNDRGPGGLTWTINPVLSSSAPNAAFHVSQYGQDVYISIAAATAGVVATGYNSTTLSTFTGDTVALRLDTTMSDATELASFEIGTNSTNKIDIYPYNGVLYSVAWDSTNNLNSCGTGYAYLVQGGGLSCSAPTLVYQPSAMPFLRICLGCNLNGASRTSTTWYTDYSSDGLADSANSHWVAYGSIAKASFSWSSTSGVIVYMGAEAVTTTGTYPGYAKFSCVAVNGQGGCGGAISSGTLNAGPGLLGTNAVNTVISSTVANAAGHFTNLQVVTSLGGTCSTVPVFNVFDGTSNTGSTVSASASTQTKGNGTSTAQTLTFAVGDVIGIYISTAGATCTTDQFIVSAQYSIP